MARVFQGETTPGDWVLREWAGDAVDPAAGRMAARRRAPASAGTFATTGAVWVGFLVGVIVIVGGLTFLPALALGPLAEALG